MKWKNGEEGRKTLWKDVIQKLYLADTRACCESNAFLALEYRSISRRDILFQEQCDCRF